MPESFPRTIVTSGIGAVRSTQWPADLVVDDFQTMTDILIVKPFTAQSLRDEMEKVSWRHHNLLRNNGSSAGIGSSNLRETAMAIDAYSQILLVDDSGTVRNIVREFLKQLGFKKVDEASDGEAALAKIREKRYELVIADWNMQPMNGQELLEQIRATEENADLYFIMMTAETGIDKIVQAKRAGVSGFINKPFNAEALRDKIAQIGGK
jgi:two-component system chemotaxis response regulator CheY